MNPADENKIKPSSYLPLLTLKILQLRYRDNQVDNIALHNFEQFFPSYHKRSSTKINYQTIIQYTTDQQILTKYYTMVQIFAQIRPIILKQIPQQKNIYKHFVLQTKMRNMLGQTPYVDSVSSKTTFKRLPNIKNIFEIQECKKNSCGTQQTNRNRLSEKYPYLDLLNQLSINSPSSIILNKVVIDLSKMVKNLTHKKFKYWYKQLNVQGDIVNRQNHKNLFRVIELQSLSSIENSSIQNLNYINNIKDSTINLSPLDKTSKKDPIFKNLHYEQDYGLMNLKQMKVMNTNKKSKHTKKKSLVEKVKLSPDFRKSKTKQTNSQKTHFPLTPQPHYRIHYDYFNDVSHFEAIKPLYQNRIITLDKNSSNLDSTRKLKKNKHSHQSLRKSTKKRSYSPAKKTTKIKIYK